MKTHYLVLLFALLTTIIGCNMPIEIDDNFEKQEAISNQDSSVYLGKNTYNAWQKVEKFYKNGNIKEQYLLFEGQKKGKTTAYYRNGSVWQTGDYLKGKKTGKWQYFFLKAGTDSISVKEKELYYTDGSKNGLSIEWHKNGKKSKQITYEMDNQEGEASEWYENGQLSSLMTFKNHLADGKARLWYPDGLLKMKVNFEQGKRVGMMRDWYKNGQMMRELNHNKNGERHGPFQIWNEEGQLIGSGIFENGGLIETNHH